MTLVSWPVVVAVNATWPLGMAYDRHEAIRDVARKEWKPVDRG
jgi:hypothetical protein